MVEMTEKSIVKLEAEKKERIKEIKERVKLISETPCDEVMGKTCPVLSNLYDQETELKISKRSIIRK